MNILYDLRPLTTPVSGVARHALDLINSISKQCDYNIKALYRGNLENNIELAKIGRYPIPSDNFINHNLFKFILEFLPNLSPYLLSRRYDLVHETFFANVLKDKNVKKICTIHDVIPLDNPEFFSKKNFYFAKRNFYRQCFESDHIIADSIYTKKRIIELSKINDEKVSVIPLGYSPQKYDLRDEFLEMNKLNNKRYLLFVGNVEPRKNIKLISSAIKKLGPKYQDVYFVLAGHLNYLSEEIIKHCEQDLGRRFIYLGFVSESQKWTLLRKSIGFIFASHYEGFGIPVVECYEAECPILIANNTSLKELAVNEDQLFDCKSSDDLKCKIENLISNNEWRENIVKLGKESTERYNYERIGKETINIYNKILSK